MATSQEPLRSTGAAGRAARCAPPSGRPTGRLLKRSNCPGRAAARLVSRSPSGTRWRCWDISAPWTACRWPSSWPRRPGRPVLSAEQIAARGWATASRCWVPATGPPRAGSRTLRATLVWSHDLLSAPEQILLRRLSVFIGWSLEMAEQGCGAARGGRGRPRPEGLVDKSLVVVEPEVIGQARYRMLDSMPTPPQGRGRSRGDPGPAARPRAGRASATRRWAWPPSRAVCRVPPHVANLRQVAAGTRRPGAVGAPARPEIVRAPPRASTGVGLELGSQGALGLWLAWPSSGGPRACLNHPGPGGQVGPPGPGAMPQAAGLLVLTATGQNVLAEAALQTGQLPESAQWAAKALATAREAGNAWNGGVRARDPGLPQPSLGGGQGGLGPERVPLVPGVSRLPRGGQGLGRPLGGFRRAGRSAGPPQPARSAPWPSRPAGPRPGIAPGLAGPLARRAGRWAGRAGRAR